MKDRMHLGAKPIIFERAKRMRTNQTSSERLLWEAINGKQLRGLKFRRQHPILTYILDFYCHELKLGIEIDGDSHNEEQQKLYDQKRTELLNAKGITIIRFGNQKIQNDLEGVLAEISAFTPPIPLKGDQGVKGAIHAVLTHGQFINGPQVDQFARSLEHYLGAKHVIPCANGTDALQIAMMALGLKPGDEVIVPAFTYIAPAEVMALLGLQIVWADVDANTFNIKPESIIASITPKTKAIVAVHLFGQCADMDAIMDIAVKHQLYVIEDNAQSLGSKYTFKDGKTVSAGCIGHIGTTSFFPSKNLACCGDGGAIMTQDDELAQRIKMIANHGQSQKYHHEVVGVNSRLDTIQAAILEVKLPHL
ncbi:MAG TPA: aminotransferase class V-fold PLP-dependent enzyme, partial [Saprospiraceae bacterium]|nr:aminotransferase class V-fold PLP-dependent enzyme [Saprospiraceae bacterium]